MGVDNCRIEIKNSDPEDCDLEQDQHVNGQKEADIKFFLEAHFGKTMFCLVGLLGSC
ncbi:unnamed protein product [Prunus brigantina]